MVEQKVVPFWGEKKKARELGGARYELALVKVLVAVRFWGVQSKRGQRLAGVGDAISDKVYLPDAATEDASKVLVRGPDSRASTSGTRRKLKLSLAERRGSDRAKEDSEIVIKPSWAV